MQNHDQNCTNAQAYHELHWSQRKTLKCHYQAKGECLLNKFYSHGYMCTHSDRQLKDNGGLKSVTSPC